LTVTDDDGATGTVTKQVTVTAPVPDPDPDPDPDPVVEPLAADAFGRTVSSGWGSADRGGAWTISGGAANATVTGGAGQLTGAPRVGLAGVLAGVSAQDVAVQTDVILPQAPTGGGTFVSLGGRQVGATDYRTTLWFQSDGAVNIRLDRMIEWNETILVSRRLLDGYQPGSSVTVRFEVEGSTLRVKAWLTGTAEPAAWTLTTTDSTAGLQRPGVVFVETYTSGSATRASAIRFDNYWVGAPGKTRPTP
jgi:hypothetical protein